MSRITENGSYTLTYPNAWHFAFVPALFDIAEQSGADFTADILITAGGRIFKEVRESFGGRLTFDLSRFMQMAFSNLDPSVVDYTPYFERSPLTRSVNVTYVITGPQYSVSGAFDTTAVWGALYRGQSTAGIRPRVQFGSLPFSLDFYRGEEEGVFVGDIDFPYHGGTEGVTDKVLFIADIANEAGLTDGEQVKVFVQRSLTIEDGQVKQPSEAGYMVRYKACEDGVYLRWIDGRGDYCYYLFTETANSTAITAESWQRHEMLDPTIYIQGVNVATNVRQSFASQVSRTLTAKLVERGIFEMLASLATSPVVDEFDGYDEEGLPLWHRVNVSANNIDRGAQDLQDFNVVILEPTQKTQEL